MTRRNKKLSFPNGVTIRRDAEEYIWVNVDNHNYAQFFVPRGTTPTVRISGNGGWLVYKEHGREHAVLLHTRFPVGGPYPPHPWAKEAAS